MAFERLRRRVRWSHYLARLPRRVVKRGECEGLDPSHLARRLGSLRHEVEAPRSDAAQGTTKKPMIIIAQVAGRERRRRRARRKGIAIDSRSPSLAVSNAVVRSSPAADVTGDHSAWPPSTPVVEETALSSHRADGSVMYCMGRVLTTARLQVGRDVVRPGRTTPVSTMFIAGVVYATVLPEAPKRFRSLLGRRRRTLGRLR